MEIIWKDKAETSPYLFLQRAVWPGLKIHRARVMPGRLVEECDECHMVSISLDGRLTTDRITASGKRLRTTTGRGNFCLTPAGQPFEAFWDDPLDNMSLLLEPDFVSKTALENFFKTCFEFKEIYTNKDPLIEQIGLTLLSEAENDSPAGKLYADSLIQTLTLHLLKNYTDANRTAEAPTGGLSGYKLRRVREFIDAHLEEDLSLGEIAEVADLSQFHFARAFRKSTGQTPQQYLMQKRIERAKQLLEKGDLPIVEISLRTGFKNQSHFTTLFRKFTNFTPKTWRELKLA